MSGRWKLQLKAIAVLSAGFIVMRSPARAEAMMNGCGFCVMSALGQQCASPAMYWSLECDNHCPGWQGPIICLNRDPCQGEHNMMWIACDADET